ncbi:target of trans acting-siR480/255 protein [Arabidopsis thaliana]|nr:target of trans acting-siR480/255 protein [Arabidopsis thaliana]AEE85674.1 target of trans acting-siR480/255 protein [Arabidopsis thaliana]|eukprot:NP_001154277.1 target of trans acting-siR480/255 protein [Arabidopsis thaliana]
MMAISEKGVMAISEKGVMATKIDKNGVLRELRRHFTEFSLRDVDLCLRSSSQMESLLECFAITDGKCHPDCLKANNEQEDYDACQSAALVAVSLISSARVIFKIDSKYTEYSPQYLVDNVGKEEVEGEMDQPSCQYTVGNLLSYLVENVWTKKEVRQREMDQQRREFTVKDCFEFAFKKGLPRNGHWAHVGCIFPVPPFACQIPRVPMKGEVIEAANVSEALKLGMQQPAAARLHLFSPEFDLVGEGIYDGPSGNETRYVGLRDVLMVEAEKIKGETVFTVQICYKKKTSFVKVSTRSMILPLNGDDESQVTEPACLLVDFCIPRFSIN